MLSLHKLLFAAVLAFVVFAAFAQSQPQSQPRSKSSPLSEQKSSQQPTPTINFPTSQQITQSIAEGMETAIKKYEARHPAPPPDNSTWWFNFWLVTFTGGLVFVGAAQGYLIFWTLKATQMAAISAEKSADALIASERAYVFVKNFVPVDLRDASGSISGWQCIVVWGNSGTTPTQDMTTWTSWGVFEKPISDDFDFPDHKVDGAPYPGTSFIGPKAEIHAAAFFASVQDAIALRDGIKFLYIWG